jgi:hypothetical protein
MRKTSVLGLIVTLLASGTVGCGPEELESGRLDREITIDGQFADWQGALKYVEDAGLSVGLLNDDNFLYIALVIGEDDRTWRRGGTDEFDGLSAAAHAGRDALVAEFRIPLEKMAQFGYGVGASGGDVVSVGLESKEIDMGEIRGQSGRGTGGGPPGGGRGGGMSGGGGGMRGGGRGGPGGGERPEPPEPIKVWTRVVLAAGG